MSNQFKIRGLESNNQVTPGTTITIFINKDVHSNFTNRIDLNFEIDGNKVPRLDFPSKAIVRGDEKSLSIAAASIVAKSKRDAFMASLSKLYPGYGWEKNAGYGTRGHLAAIEREGITVHHRRSFKPIANYL